MKSTCIPLTLILTAALLTVSPAFAREYHVSLSGDDRNAGSQRHPFRTISKAADMIEAGDVCTVHEGTYSETVKPKNQGTEKKPILFRAAKGEKVLITGADRVTGWKQEAPGVFNAHLAGSLGKDNQVFFDERMMNEARWPNKKSPSLLVADAAKITSGGNGWIVCSDLPDNLADDSLKNAVIWVMADCKWSSWTATVTGYTAKEKKISFAPSDNVWIREWHNPSHGGEFYLVGSPSLFDAENEWYYDEATGTLHIRTPNGDDPNQHHVYAKARPLAFDLSKEKHVVVKGFHIEAATISLADAEDCTVESVDIKYLSHTRGGNTLTDAGEPTGIFVSGKRNTIRDSEIAFSVGDGVALHGTGHKVINCWIHDTDYLGCYGSPVKLSGIGNMISHCTINDTGRDCILLGGARHLVQYNDIYHPGMLAHDLGCLYTGGNDAGESEIHHNVMHDNLTPGVACGLYLDNYSSNYVMHHNVLRNCGSDLRLNNPSSYNLAFNNTFGVCGFWGRWPDRDRMFGDYLINNQGKIDVHHDYFMTSNSTDEKSVPGVVIPGITSNSPNTGAYEGRKPFKVGHDFKKKPNPVYKLSKTPYTNQVINGTFDLPGGTTMTPWKTIGAGKGTVVYSEGFVEDYDTRDSIFGNSIHLAGTPQDGIEQTVNGLVGGAKYILAAQVKTADGAKVRLGIRDASGRKYEITSESAKWDLVKVEFSAGTNPSPVTVYVVKEGKGTAYADNIGLQAVFPTAGGG